MLILLGYFISGMKYLQIMKENGYIFAGAVLACLSLVFSIFTIFLHIWIPQMMKHPGKLVFIQCIAQLVYDFHWLTALNSFHK